MSFSWRYSLRLIQAFINRFKTLIILGIFLGVIIFLVINYLIFPFFFLGKTERIGIAGQYRIEKLPLGITSLISDGLTKINDDGTVEPALSQNWETPDKGKTWIFHLAEGKKWQSGEDVISEDISYQFSDVEVEKPDAKTIIFKLKNPFSPFPTVVAKPIFKKGLLGTGKWKVKKISLNGEFVKSLELTDNQHNKKIFKFEPTEERLKTAFKLGQVDILENVFNPEPFDKWSSVKIYPQVNKKQIVTLFFNTTDPLLSEKSLRQALIYAIDKNKLSENKALSPISPLSWAFNPLVKPYDYDPQKAKQFIDDLPAEAKKNLTVKINTSPALLNLAEEIGKMWQPIGINAQVSASASIPDEYQALLIIFEPPDDPDQYSIWHSTQNPNYKNPRIDSLLEEGRSTINPEERGKIYLDFQRFLVEDAPAAFLFHPTFYTISRK